MQGSVVRDLPSSELPITSSSDTASDLYDRSGYDPQGALFRDTASDEHLRNVRVVRRGG
jgi:hypothetical protein